MRSAKYQTDQPRSWLALFFIYRGWLSLVGAGVLIFWSGAAMIYVHQTDRFNDTATKAEAQVIRVRRDEAVVRYVTPQGTYAATLPQGSLEVGDEIDIWYRPAQPLDVQRSYRRHVPPDMILAQTIGLLSGLAALVVLWWSGRQASEAIRTRRFGPLLPATVTRIEEGRDEDGDPNGKGRLYWREADRRTGKSTWFDLRHVRKWPVGVQIEVYRGPKRSWWRDDLGPRDALQSSIPSVKSSQPHET